jgi:Tol biopolymer transport system component
VRRLAGSLLLATLAGILIPTVAFADGVERWRASALPDGGDANGHSSYYEAPALVSSGSGPVPVFSSYASNLVPGDTNRYSDIFAVIDGETVLLTKDYLSDQPADGPSWEPVAAPSGDRFVFASAAANLVQGDLDQTFLTGMVGGEVGPGTTSLHEATDIFVGDLTGAFTKVTVGLNGLPADDASSDPSIGGPNGTVVAFASKASNLVEGDTNQGDPYFEHTDVFVRDLESGVTERISVGPGGAQANNSSVDTAVSASGRFVAYASMAKNLVDDDVNGYAPDVFLRDLVTDTTTLVSTTSTGQQIDRGSLSPSINADGTLVVFESLGQLVTEDTDDRRDIYLKDLTSGAAQLVSTEVEGDACNPKLDPGGTVVTFVVTQDDGYFYDCSDYGDGQVYARFLDLAAPELLSTSSSGAPAAGISGFPALSADASQVAFASNAPDLVDGDRAGMWDVFVQDLLRPAMNSAPTAAISLTPTSVQGAAPVRVEAAIVDLDGVSDIVSGGISVVDAKGRTVATWRLTDFVGEETTLTLVRDLRLSGSGPWTATISAVDAAGAGATASAQASRK